MYKHIPSEKLFISEPNPGWFGNPANQDPKVNWLKSRFHFSFAGKVLISNNRISRSCKPKIWSTQSNE